MPVCPQGLVPKLSPLVQKMVRKNRESKCCRRRAGESGGERAVVVPASLPGCGVGCSISDMVAQMPLSLPVGELGQERGLLGVGGSEHHAAAREILPCTARPEENWQGGWGGS